MSKTEESYKVQDAKINYPPDLLAKYSIGHFLGRLNQRFIEDFFLIASFLQWNIFDRKVRDRQEDWRALGFKDCR